MTIQLVHGGMAGADGNRTHRPGFPGPPGLKPGEHTSASSVPTRLVGLAGFGPAYSWSQARRVNQITLQAVGGPCRCRPGVHRL